MAMIPTITELYTSIISDIESKLGITVPSISKNFIKIFAAVQAAKLKLYYLYSANIKKNVFIDTAEPEALGGTLERFGRVKLNRNPFPATPGEYIVEVTGSIGAVIPASTTFKSDDDSTSPGYLFVLDDEYELIATTDTITLRALTTGLESQLEVGDTLTATAPIINVDSIATVDSITVAPLAAESLEDYREKAILAYRLEPQGGAAADYRLWGFDAQGVANIYPFARTGYSNEVIVFVEATIADSTDGKGTPTAGILAEVAEVIETNPDTTLLATERGRRPLGVFNVEIAAITVKEIDIKITGYVGLTSDIEALLTSALETALASVRPFVSAIDTLDQKNDIFSTFNIIYIIQQAIPGSIFSSVELKVNSVVFNSYLFDNGNIPHLNSVTYA